MNDEQLLENVDVYIPWCMFIHWAIRISSFAGKISTEITRNFFLGRYCHGRIFKMNANELLLASVKCPPLEPLANQQINCKPEKHAIE